MSKVIDYFKNMVGIELEEDTSGNLNMITPQPSVNTGTVYLSGVCSTASGFWNVPSSNSTVTINPNYTFWGSGGGLNYPQSSVIQWTPPTPEEIRKNRIQQLKTELQSDPELLNEILVDLRKDKIEKIRNKNGF